MGGLTHRNGNMNLCKWYEAVDTWLQYDVDIILLSEMQPNDSISDVTNSQYLLDYNPEGKRRPGKGTGCAFHQQLRDALTRIKITSPQQSGFWILHLVSTTIIIGAWYSPVNSNCRPIDECKVYWKA